MVKLFEVLTQTVNEKDKEKDAQVEHNNPYKEELQHKVEKTRIGVTEQEIKTEIQRAYIRELQDANRSRNQHKALKESPVKEEIEMSSNEENKEENDDKTINS